MKRMTHADVYLFMARNTDEIPPWPGSNRAGDDAVEREPRPDPAADARLARRGIIIAFLAEQRGTVASALLPMYPQGTDGYARSVIAALVQAAQAWEGGAE